VYADLRSYDPAKSTAAHSGNLDTMSEPPYGLHAFDEGSHTDWKDLLVRIKNLNQLVIYLGTCCNAEDSSEFMKGLRSAMVMWR
jgi:hypothetical protein